jgi:hypothetical protein
MAKGAGFGPGAKKMGGPGKKPLPPAPGPIGGGSAPGGPPGSPMGAFKKGGVVKKPKGKK